MIIPKNISIHCCGSLLAAFLLISGFMSTRRRLDIADASESRKCIEDKLEAQISQSGHNDTTPIHSRPRRVYIDLGVNIGAANSVQEFYNAIGAEQFTNWVVHGFEPNPLFKQNLDSHSLKLGYNYHFAAAAPSAGNLTFYYNKKGGNPQSGSLRQEGRSAVAPDEIVVPAIDFAEFLKSNFRHEDFVVVKMDIEGSEYELARQLLISGAFCLIDWFCFESHGAPFDSKPSELSLKTVCEFDRIIEYFGDACPSKMCFFTSLFHKTRMAQTRDSWYGLLKEDPGHTDLSFQCPDFERKEYEKCM